MLGKRKAPIKRPPTQDAETEKGIEPTVQQIVDVKLVEKERLKELLRERLVECGWSDEMKSLCREFTRKKGRNDVTVDELINVMTPRGRGSVPDSVKAEMFQRIRSFLASTTT
ncbi:transcription/mRNA export factor [Perilla frutescens var. frutescens]|nr:transcription/mRNA export factor [Perilla frutescens var. frutescens]